MALNKSGIKRIKRNHAPLDVPRGGQVKNAQVQTAVTDDGDFYRTAFILKPGITAPVDILAPDGTHLCRILINGSSYPSVDIVTPDNLRQVIIIRENGSITHNKFNYTQMTTIEIHNSAGGDDYVLA